MKLVTSDWSFDGVFFAIEFIPENIVMIFNPRASVDIERVPYCKRGLVELPLSYKDQLVG